MFERKDFVLGDVATVRTYSGKEISGEIISYAVYGHPDFKQYEFLGIKTSPKEVEEFPLENVIKIIPKYGRFQTPTSH